MTTNDQASPEKCTTESRRKSHLSINLRKLSSGDHPGRWGTTLCGYNAEDETLINYRQNVRGRDPIKLADLPVCNLCERSRRRIERKAGK